MIENLEIRVRGTVTAYNVTKSFGFIKISDEDFRYRNKDAFIHFKDIQPNVSWQDQFKKLQEGQVVEFDLHKGVKGFKAKNLEIIQ